MKNAKTLITSNPAASFSAAALAIATLAFALMPQLPALAQDAKKDDKAKPASAPKAALTVQLTTAQTTQIATQIAANGTVAAWQEASVSVESNGLRLTSLNAEVGQFVKRGQVLATFAAETLQADVAQAKASLAEAQAAAADATANAERARSLQNTGALSAQQITQMLTAELSTKARVLAVEAAVKSQELRLKQAVVVAPDAGVVIARPATLGAVLPAGFELYRLQRLGRIEWRAEVNATALPRIHAGMLVKVQPIGGQMVDGKVRMISPTIDAQTRNATVFVDLPAGSARAGGFASGTFATGSGQALTLPASALVLRDGFSYAMRVDGNKVTQVKLSLGKRSADRVEITAGVKAGEQFVASGAAFLANGDTVRVAAGK